MIWPQTAPFWLDLFGRAMHGGKPFQAEQIHQELDRHFLVSAFVLEDRRVDTTFIDISDQKKIEAWLNKSRRILEDQVGIRTAELLRANQKLQGEIESRELTHKEINLQSYLKSLL